jgi:hypothetical protein
MFFSELPILLSFVAMSMVAAQSFLHHYLSLFVVRGQNQRCTHRIKKKKVKPGSFFIYLQDHCCEQCTEVSLPVSAEERTGRMRNQNLLS